MLALSTTKVVDKEAEFLQATKPLWSQEDSAAGGSTCFYNSLIAMPAPIPVRMKSTVSAVYDSFGFAASKGGVDSVLTWKPKVTADLRVLTFIPRVKGGGVPDNPVSLPEVASTYWVEVSPSAASRFVTTEKYNLIYLEQRKGPTGGYMPLLQANLKKGGVLVFYASQQLGNRDLQVLYSQKFRVKMGTLPRKRGQLRDRYYYVMQKEFEDGAFLQIQNTFVALIEKLLRKNVEPDYQVNWDNEAVQFENLKTKPLSYLKLSLLFSLLLRMLTDVIQKKPTGTSGTQLFYRDLFYGVARKLYKVFKLLISILYSYVFMSTKFTAKLGRTVMSMLTFFVPQLKVVTTLFGGIQELVLYNYRSVMKPKEQAEKFVIAARQWSYPLLMLGFFSLSTFVSVTFFMTTPMSIDFMVAFFKEMQWVVTSLAKYIPGGQWMLSAVFYVLSFLKYIPESAVVTVVSAWSSLSAFYYGKQMLDNTLVVENGQCAEVTRAFYYIDFQLDVKLHTPFPRDKCCLQANYFATKAAALAFKSKLEEKKGEFIMFNGRGFCMLQGMYTSLAAAVYNMYKYHSECEDSWAPVRNDIYLPTGIVTDQSKLLLAISEKYSASIAVLNEEEERLRFTRAPGIPGGLTTPTLFVHKVSPNIYKIVYNLGLIFKS